MIKRIFANGFKGMDFDQPLGQRSILVGRVGSGKSSRPLALALLVSGAMPNTGIGRTNSDIFDAVASGDAFTVGLETDDGKTLERTYKRGKKGSISCSHRVNGEATPKNLFELELANEGFCLADVASFHALSDTKKIDELFRLFPPQGDVRGINVAIAQTKEAISRIEADIKAREQSCQNLGKAIADMELPAGTLPEIQAQIAQLEREYQEARDEMVREKTRLEEASAQARQCGEAREACATQAPLMGEVSAKNDAPPCQSGPIDKADPGILDSLKKVMSALEGAGCEACAAKMILRREMKNLMAEAVNG